MTSLHTQMLQMKRRRKRRSLPSTVFNLVTRQTPTQFSIMQGKRWHGDTEKAMDLMGQLLYLWQVTASGAWAGPCKKWKNEEKGCSVHRSKGWNNSVLGKPRRPGLWPITHPRSGREWVRRDGWDRVPGDWLCLQLGLSSWSLLKDFK